MANTTVRELTQEEILRVSEEIALANAKFDCDDVSNGSVIGYEIKSLGDCISESIENCGISDIESIYEESINRVFSEVQNLYPKKVEAILNQKGIEYHFNSSGNFVIDIEDSEQS